MDAGTWRMISQIAVFSGAVLAALGGFGNWYFTEKPHVVGFYRGGGQRLQSGRQWTTVKRAEQHPPGVPYFIGPFEIRNDGDAVTSKKLIAWLDCSSPFQAYSDPALAPTDPSPVWQLNPIEAVPMFGPGRPAIYRYAKHLDVIGPGESAVLYGFWLNPSEREVRCELIVTSGTKKPTTLALNFRFNDWPGPKGK